MYDAVLFDFDGVIADTEPLHYLCWRRLFVDRRLDLTWSEYSQVLRGYSGKELLARVSHLFHHSSNFDQIENLYAEKQALYHRLTASCRLISDSVVAFVHRLPVPCAVVTSSKRVDVERVLLRVGLLTRFSAIVHCDEPKPAPDGYQQAIVALGIQRPLAVEDSEPGIQSAKAAGLDVLRVPSPTKMPTMVTAKLYGPSQG
jgi:beta-phosphoglucomutase